MGTGSLSLSNRRPPQHHPIQVARDKESDEDALRPQKRERERQVAVNSQVLTGYIPGNETDTDLTASAAIPDEDHEFPLDQQLDVL